MKRIIIAAAAGLFAGQAAAQDPSPEHVVQGIYDAFAAGDIDAFAAALHPEIVWMEAENNTYADNNPYEGPQAVVDGVIGRVGADWENFTVTPQEMISEGNRVVMLGRYSGTYRATGEPIDAQVVHVWTVQDGQAVAFQQYVDTLQLAEAEQAD
ncbi:nuclear transport factor 2 family protein [Marinicauda algicola]|uniref:Nuclear transport factor 2 family protein n=1 Tax=Marinicauda algicola TaxID=2029849 RepID=A0A4S2H121_9PROT|nr:nuclear transport factor 2 family protein [Marinicauda algicola]TGY88951.1 nuclear transport factor 2 family protein [Marinicauda algicola]